MYLTLKWIHILAAVVALGTNLTYSIWLTKAHKSPDSLLFTLRNIKILDDRLATPAYVLSLISGVGMVLVSGMSIMTPWLLLSLILYTAVVILGLGGYTPTLNRQIAVVEQGGALSARLQRPRPPRSNLRYRFGCSRRGHHLSHGRQTTTLGITQISYFHLL